VTDEPIDPELDGLLDLLAEEERGRPDPVEHPSAATLSAYHARALPAGEVSRVQDHLVACRQCREQLLEHARFLEPPAEDPADGTASFERAAEWRRLKERMGEEVGAPAPPPTATDDRRRLLRSLRAFQALAAALGALAIGLFLRDAYIPSPARVLPEQSLTFGTTRSVPESKPKPEQVHPPVALRILPEAEYSRYRVEIETASGQLKQTLEIAPESLDGALIEIPESWSPGTYKIRVLGLKDGRTEPVGRPREIVVVR
jgi:hypothetical protein